MLQKYSHVQILGNDRNQNCYDNDTTIRLNSGSAFYSQNYLHKPQDVSLPFS